MLGWGGGSHEQLTCACSAQVRTISGRCISNERAHRQHRRILGKACPDEARQSRNSICVHVHRALVPIVWRTRRHSIWSVPCVISRSCMDCPSAYSLAGLDQAARRSDGARARVQHECREYAALRLTKQGRALHWHMDTASACNMAWSCKARYREESGRVHVPRKFRQYDALRLS